jgi:hypothetical protein
LTKKKKVNEGEVPQYYIEESHEAIISPEEFEERTESLDYFDESVWKLTIEKVTIFHDGRMIFQFVDGTEIEG